MLVEQQAANNTTSLSIQSSIIQGTEKLPLAESEGTKEE
jgi:hypothetical protein